MLALAALAWLAVLAWPHALAAVEALREWLQPASVPQPASGTTP
jgi:hypothetical protein